MKMLLITMTVLPLAVLLVSPGALYAQETDPEAVIAALIQAVNAGDIEAALALFADDASVTIVPPPPGMETGTFTGPEEIRGWLEGLKAMNVKIELEILQVDGGTVTARNVFWADMMQPLGIGPLVAMDVYTVSDGRLTSLTSTLTDESLAEMQAAMAALPETGGTTPIGTLLLWLGAGGLLLLALGLGLRRASGHAR